MAGLDHRTRGVSGRWWLALAALFVPACGWNGADLPAQLPARTRGHSATTSLIPGLVPFVGRASGGLAMARRQDPPAESRTVLAVSSAGDWPQFRGPRRDGVSRETGLLKSWPANGPRLAWVCRDLGRGYSGPAVVGDTVYILGTVGQEEAVIALDLATGRRRWTAPLGPIFENPWGNGPRGTPTIDGQRLYALTPAGHLAALSLEDGKLVWSRELESDFEGEAPFWGYSESPLVDGDRLIVTPGGENALVALDKRTGALVWKSSGLDDGAQYSSIVPAQAGGQAIYLTMMDRGLVGVSARTGALVLRDDRTKNGTAHCTLPVVHAGHVYTTSGFGAGCALLRLAEPFAIAKERDQEPSQPISTEVYASSLMKNQHGGVVLVDGSLFGYSDGAGWTCHDFLAGELRWSDKESLPKGSLIAADGRLYCLSEKDGTVALLEPAIAGWREHGRLTLPEGTRLGRGKGGVWTHPVVSHGRLLVRDQELLFAFDIGVK